MKRHLLFGTLCVFVMFAVKFCMFLNYLATSEAKWSVSFVNKTALENPVVKVRIAGYDIPVKPGQEAFWGPDGDVEEVKTPCGTHAVVTDLSNSQTELDITLYPGDEPPLPKNMVVTNAEGAYLLRRDTGYDFEKDCLGTLPCGTRVRAIKRGAPLTQALRREDERTEFPPWVTKEKLWTGSVGISAPWIKVSIPKEARKGTKFPRTAWVFGGNLAEAKDAEGEGE